MGKNWNEQESYVRNVGLCLRQSYDSEGRIEYVGYAYPNTTTSELRWQIFKCTYDSNGRLITRIYGNGSDDFSLSWDLRTTYNYDQ